MVWTVVGGVPTQGQVSNTGIHFLEWDLQGFQPGTGYRLFRSSSSRLVAVECRSADPRSGAYDWYHVKDEWQPGSERASDPLPDNVAVIARLDCLPAQPRAHTWLYLPCLCHNVTDTGRPNRVNRDARGPLRLCLDNLIILMGPRLDAIVVALTTQVGNVEIRPCPISQVSNANMDAARVRTQRRRLNRQL